MTRGCIAEAHEGAAPKPEGSLDVKEKKETQKLSDKNRRGIRKYSADGKKRKKRKWDEAGDTEKQNCSKKSRARSKLEKKREKKESHKKLGCVGATKEDGKKS